MSPLLRCFSKQVFLLYSSSRRCGKMRILRFIRWALFPSPREVASDTRRVASYCQRGFRETREIFVDPFTSASQARRIRALPVAVLDMSCDFCERGVLAGERYLTDRDGDEILTDRDRDAICCVPCFLGR
jgi:hypothetical protein